jgi:hypothetical protein
MECLTIYTVHARKTVLSFRSTRTEAKERALPLPQSDLKPAVYIPL